jgi:hypothetical protein
MGEGSGWGTIAGVRLRILVLASTDRTEAERLVRLLSRHHDARLGKAAGLFAGLQAAKAARALAPDLVHAIGVDGAAKSAHAIAAGIGAPLIAGLSAADLDDKRRRRALERAKDAAALVIDDGKTADLLRTAGVTRDIYVIASPDPKDDIEARTVLEAIEVVYGRIIGALRPDVAGREKEPELVRIGSTSGKGSR